MNCKKCNSMLEEGDSFCIRCGAKVESGNGYNPTPTASGANGVPNNNVYQQNQYNQANAQKVTNNSDNGYTPNGTTPMAAGANSTPNNNVYQQNQYNQVNTQGVTNNGGNGYTPNGTTPMAAGANSMPNNNGYQQNGYQQNAYQQNAYNQYNSSYAQGVTNNGGMRSQKDWLITLLLSIFLGGLGVHRFYVGKIGTGVLQLLTAGGCGIWALVDFIMIATGKFTDENGYEIKR